jgi:DNA-binding HxlR family transcriptional regulator
MRSYKQHCALAKALDLIGDRWALLIVRELLINHACRYTDLLNGLPGIATNLLTTRLCDLEASGVIKRSLEPPPIATTLFRLTEWGKALEPIIFQLGMWAAPLLGAAPRGDSFRMHWLVIPIRHAIRDHRPEQDPISIEASDNDESITIEAGKGNTRVRSGNAERADVSIKGKRELIAGLLLGKLDLSRAQARGLKLRGDPEILRRVQPLA